LAQQVQQVQSVLQVQSVQQARQGHKVSSVQLEPQAQSARQAQQVQIHLFQALLVSQVQSVRQAQQVQQAQLQQCLAQLVRLVHKVRLVQTVVLLRFSITQQTRHQLRVGQVLETFAGATLHRLTRRASISTTSTILAKTLISCWRCLKQTISSSFKTEMSMATSRSSRSLRRQRF
jgi:hypothetical protein